MSGKRAKLIRHSIFGDNADVRVYRALLTNKSTAFNDPQSLRAQYQRAKKEWKNK